jgi:carbon storage regulator
MLVLAVKPGEPIWIGDDIVLFVSSVRSPHQVRIGIDAPKDVRILRDSVKERMHREKDGLHEDP